MRTLAGDLVTAQATSERTPLGRLTFRDLRLQFDVEYDGNLPGSTVAFSWANGVMGASCEDAAGHIHQACVRSVGGTVAVYYRQVEDLTTFGSTAWAAIPGT